MFTFSIRTARRMAGVLAGLLVLLMTARSAQSQDRLWRGNSLRPGQYLLSQNERYQFVFQYDGNVVLYDLWDRHRALWASNTVNWRPANGHYADWRTADTLAMQGDGNLVVYGHSFGPYFDIWNNPAYHQNSIAFWASNSNSDLWANHNADPMLVVLNDGNVVIYVYPLTSNISPIWATNTWR